MCLLASVLVNRVDARKVEAVFHGSEPNSLVPDQGVPVLARWSEAEMDAHWAAGTVEDAEGIATGGGRVFVTDSGRSGGRVVVLREDGLVEAIWGGGVLDFPHGVRAREDGTLDVADTRARRVFTFYEDGARARTSRRPAGRRHGWPPEGQPPRVGGQLAGHDLRAG